MFSVYYQGFSGRSFFVVVNSLEDEIDCSINGDIREQALYVEGGDELVFSRLYVS